MRTSAWLLALGWSLCVYIHRHMRIRWVLWNSGTLGIRRWWNLGTGGESCAGRLCAYIHRHMRIRWVLGKSSAGGESCALWNPGVSRHSSESGTLENPGAWWRSHWNSRRDSYRLVVGFLTGSRMLFSCLSFLLFFHCLLSYCLLSYCPLFSCICLLPLLFFCICLCLLLLCISISIFVYVCVLVCCCIVAGSGKRKKTEKNQQFNRRVELLVRSVKGAWIFAGGEVLLRCGGGCAILWYVRRC